MRSGLSSLLIWLGALLGAGPALAQSAEEAPVEDSTGAVDPKGRFGRAQVLGAEGQAHTVYVPLGHEGFSRTLPFYRSAEETRQVHISPFSISVDKVQSMTLNGQYFEHLTIKGKRQHILALRVADGPVELFNYTETSPVMIPVAGTVVGLAVAATAVAVAGATDGLQKRHWYLRRGTEVVRVQRGTFMAQITQYFADDPATVDAVVLEKLRYRDILTLVQNYNRRPAGR